MSVPIIRITVIPMLIAQIQTEPSHVLANLALLAPELLVLVSKDPSAYLIIKILCYFSILIFFCILADVDECTANTHNCHSDATCTNTNGGFTCACKSGFQGPGTSCTGK